jgi:hypothetical protein
MAFSCRRGADLHRIDTASGSVKTMRKLILAGIMTLALPVAAFAQTAGTDTSAAPTTKHSATHHRAAHHTAKHTKHARTTHHKTSSTAPAASSTPVN